MTETLELNRPSAAVDRPRVGFLGVGWIGRHRMQAILDGGHVEVAAVADPSPDGRVAATAVAPGAEVADDLDGLLALDLDGLVIATPSALHARQAIRALDAGLAVFCQKPLGRTAEEVEAVVAAARRADRLLAVDLSYRFTEAVRRVKALIDGGDLGPLHAIDLTFHNAYGPDKPWFHDRAQSGGGCLMDLGVHLVDLAHWLSGADAPVRAPSVLLRRQGRPLAGDEVEDFAWATYALGDGPTVRLACSWNLHAGQDAEIGFIVHGRDGSAEVRNVGGSFYDFEARRMSGTRRERLCGPPDAWGGRAAADWARRLAEGARFDPAIATVLSGARTLDRLYAAGGLEP